MPHVCGLWSAKSTKGKKKSNEQYVLAKLPFFSFFFFQVWQAWKLERLTSKPISCKSCSLRQKSHKIGTVTSIIQLQASNWSLVTQTHCNPKKKVLSNRRETIEPHCRFCNCITDISYSFGPFRIFVNNNMDLWDITEFTKMLFQFLLTVTKNPSK